MSSIPSPMTIIPHTLQNIGTLANNHPADTKNDDYVLSFKTPSFQCQSKDFNASQKQYLIQSLWLELPIGTMTYAQVEQNNDNSLILIDGYHRLSTIQSYLNNDFTVFGSLYCDLLPHEKNRFMNIDLTFIVLTNVTLNKLCNSLKTYRRMLES